MIFSSFRNFLTGNIALSVAGEKDGKVTVGVLDEGVEEDEVVLGVLVYLVRQGTVLTGAVGRRPPVSGAALRAGRPQGLHSGTQPGIFPHQRTTFMTGAFPDESVGDETELLLVLEGFSVGIVGGRDEHRVDLVLAGGPAPLSSGPALNMNLVELSHPVEDVVHAVERFPLADLVLPQRLVASHGVEAGGTLAGLQDLLECCLKETV